MLLCNYGNRVLVLQQISSHGLFDLSIEAEGDTWIDDHHTNEDLGMLGSSSVNTFVMFGADKVAKVINAHGGLPS